VFWRVALFILCHSPLSTWTSFILVTPILVITHPVCHPIWDLSYPRLSST
jgi:hypothetical protein